MAWPTWIRRLAFWRNEAEIAPVEGFTVDGCFTLPDGSPLTAGPADGDTDAADAADAPE